MGILRGKRQSGRGLCVPDRLAATHMQTLSRDLDDATLGRCEAQAITSRAVAADPYAAWLQRRESERLRDQPAIRWVYRYPTSVGGTGSRGAGGKREASEGRSPGSEDGLVGVA